MFLPRRGFKKDQIQPEGTEFKGEDLYGNRYYEAPRVDTGRYLKTHRWMEPGTLADVKDDEFDELDWKVQNEILESRRDAAVDGIPPEWESWMRGRRAKPPTLQEQARSARILLKAQGQFKVDKAAAAATAAKAATAAAAAEAATTSPSSSFPSVHTTGKTTEEVRKDSVTGLSFPVYEDLEVTPGEELTPDDRRKRVQMSTKEKAEGKAEDDAAFVPPAVKKK